MATEIKIEEYIASLPKSKPPVERLTDYEGVIDCLKELGLSLGIYAVQAPYTRLFQITALADGALLRRTASGVPEATFPHNLPKEVPEGSSIYAATILTGAVWNRRPEAQAILAGASNWMIAMARYQLPVTLVTPEFDVTDISEDEAFKRSVIYMDPEAELSVLRKSIDTTNSPWIEEAREQVAV